MYAIETELFVRRNPVLREARDIKRCLSDAQNAHASTPSRSNPPRQLSLEPLDILEESDFLLDNFRDGLESRNHVVAVRRVFLV